MDVLDASSTRRNARFGKGGYAGYKKPWLFHGYLTGVGISSLIDIQ